MVELCLVSRRQLLYLFIILLVFDKLGRKPEAIIVAVLGLIYVTIRTIGIGQYMAFIGSMFALDQQHLNLRRLLNDPEFETAKEAYKEAEKVRDHRFVKIYIDGFFLSIVSLICLLELWTGLDK